MTKPNQKPSLSGRFGLAIWLLIGMGALPVSDAFAQLQPRPPIVAPMPMPPQWRPGWPGVQNQSIGQAKINEDADHSEEVARADRFARNGRYDLAVIVWQKILDKSHEALTTREDWQQETVFGVKFRRYASLVGEIERTIAALPPAGLRAYRAQVDPKASTILDAAAPADRETALGDVVRRYFLSSYGDDAALELASRALDRYDFVSAFQLLSRLRERYPDPSVSSNAIDVRLAAAAAHVGDHETGRQLISGLESADATFSPRALTLVNEEVERLAGGSASSSHVASSRTMLLGTETRRGHMQNISLAAAGGSLDFLWFDDFYRDPPRDEKKTPGTPQPPVPPVDPWGRVRRIRQIPSPGRATSQQVTSEQMIRRWRQMHSRPTAQVLVKDGLAFFRSHDRAMCRDIATGRLQWMSRPTKYQPAYFSPYVNHMLLPPQLRQAGNLYQVTRQPLEMLLFADRIVRSMTLCGDHLVAVEPTGDSRSVINRRVAVPNRRIAAPYVVSQPANRLAAYAQDTGKLVWTSEIKADDTEDRGDFLAAPLPAGGKLIAPLLRQDTIWLVSLDPASGEVGWQSQLCQQPDGGRSFWSPAGIAVEGSTAYVATAAGVVAAVDTRWGNIQWVATYPRGSKQNGQTVPDGCKEDIVIPHGSLVVVIASDCAEIFALDRRTGALRWSTSRAVTASAAAVDYCLGVMDDYLYLAGNRVVRCYQISGGRAVWEHPLTDSLGRGALTPETIYIPSGDSIVCLDPSPEPIAGGQRQQRELHLADTFGEPIGNLASDGQQLLGVGMSRVYRLGIDEAMAMLDGGGN